uniref:DRBM domain-containing protein n=1 Tax=Xenopsylla cheopis TaxID=163159 RepID=A0A6M2DU56_XENCH
MSGRRSAVGRTGPAFNPRSSIGAPNRAYNEGTRYNNTRSYANYALQNQAQQQNAQQFSQATAQTRNQTSYNKQIEVKEEVKAETASPLLQRQQPLTTNNVNSPAKGASAEKPAVEAMETRIGDEGADKPKPWKKNQLSKVKKLSNSERRNRQNKRLRKLLTPKNALMVLNELHGANIPEYKLGQTVAQAFNQSGHQYKAEVVVNGSTYQGQGISKIMAKNNAAEKALRDLVLERMRKEIVSDVAEGEDVEMVDADEKNANTNNTKESQIPMLHLASFALHKLFTEWQAEGYEIPLMSKNLTGSAMNLNETQTEISIEGKDVPKKLPKMRTELPPNPESIHPAMLLSQMRPGIGYVDVSTYDGISPNNGLFTVSVTVDGKDFFGAAKNKKEARKQAAQQACTSLFGVKYPVTDITAE